MNESLGSSVLDLSTDDSKLRKGMDGAEGTVKSKMGRIGGIIGKAALGGAAALAGLGAAAFAGANKVAGMADQIDKASTRIGIATDAYQELDFWASQNGVSNGEMERAVGRLNQRIGLAAAGNVKYAGAFENLGVSVTDAQGEIRATEDVLGETVQKLSQLPTEAEKSAAASEIFGTKMARTLLPALQDGSLSLADAAAKADELGLVMGEDAVAAGVRFTDGWDQTKRSVSSLFRDAMVPFMAFMADTVFPVLTETVLPAVRSLADAFGEGGLAGVVAKAGEIFGGLGPGLLSSVGDAFSSLLDFIVDNTGALVDMFLAGREAFFDAAIQIFTSIVEALPQIIPQLLAAVLTMVQTLTMTLTTLAPLLIDGALSLVLGLVSGLIDSLPMIIDSAIQIVMSITGALLEALPVLLEAGIQLLIGLLDGVITALPMLIEFIFTDLIPSLLEAVLAALPQLLEAGIMLILSLLEGIITNAPAIIGFIFTDLIPSVISALIDAVPQLVEAGLGLIIGLLDGLTGGWASDVIGWIMSIPGAIGDFFSDAGQWLVDAGKAILEGLLGGLKSGWDSVAGWVGDLGGQIKDLKGPLPDDEELLVDEGGAIMRSLQVGLDSEMRALEGLLGGVTGTITATVGEADLGGGLGEGFPDSFTADAILDLGEGIEQAVTIKFSRSNRTLKRRALAGTGAAR